MNEPAVTPQFLLNFAAALKQFSDEGYVLHTLQASRVEAGDYLISYPCEFQTPESTERVRNVKVERVVSTGAQQSSGPFKSLQFIGLEGNPEIQQYADDPEMLVVRKTEVL